jgi:hypothetical protein
MMRGQQDLGLGPLAPGRHHQQPDVIDGADGSFCFFFQKEALDVRLRGRRQTDRG